MLDTWATSSLTPWIAGGWGDDPDLFAARLPVRPAPAGARDHPHLALLRGAARAHRAGPSPVDGRGDLRLGARPGPEEDVEVGRQRGHPGGRAGPVGSDAVRYWAATARLGVDTAFDEGQLRVGRRLAVKLLNASRFVLGLPAPGRTDSAAGDAVEAAVDRAMLDRLAVPCRQRPRHSSRYGHADALAEVETFFWWFCDDHLELVKSRAYGSAAGGPGDTRARLRGHRAAAALDALLRLFAPLLPFATEEVWSWWREGSVHRAPWPEPAPASRRRPAGAPELTELASWVLAASAGPRAPRTCRCGRRSTGWSSGSTSSAATLRPAAAVRASPRGRPGDRDPQRRGAGCRGRAGRVTGRSTAAAGRLTLAAG